MARAVSVRLDDEARRALAQLEASGSTRSEAIRDAIVEAAAARRRATALRAEVETIAADTDDQHEMAEVASLMEDLREPW